MHRIPPKNEAREQWLIALKLKEGDIRDHDRVCSRHFPNGDATQAPSLCLGVKFASPKKMQSSRGIRVTKRKLLQPPAPTPKRRLPSTSPGTISSTPVSSDQTDGESSDFMSGKKLTASAGEAYFSELQCA